MKLVQKAGLREQEERDRETKPTCGYNRDAPADGLRSAETPETATGSLPVPGGEDTDHQLQLLHCGRPSWGTGTARPSPRRALPGLGGAEAEGGVRWRWTLSPSAEPDLALRQLKSEVGQGGVTGGPKGHRLQGPKPFTRRLSLHGS